MCLKVCCRIRNKTVIECFICLILFSDALFLCIMHICAHPHWRKKKVGEVHMHARFCSFVLSQIVILISLEPFTFIQPLDINCVAYSYKSLFNCGYHFFILDPSFVWRTWKYFWGCSTQGQENWSATRYPKCYHIGTECDKYQYNFSGSPAVLISFYTMINSGLFSIVSYLNAEECTCKLILKWETYIAFSFSFQEEE